MLRRWNKLANNLPRSDRTLFCAYSSNRTPEGAGKRGVVAGIVTFLTLLVGNAPIPAPTPRSSLNAIELLALHLYGNAWR